MSQADGRPMLDLWRQCDLPVLVELVQQLEVAGALRVDTPLTVGALFESQVQAALRRLEADGYIVGISTQMPYPVVVTGVTPRALRTVQAWPLAKAVVERLLVALAGAAQSPVTADERSRARRLLDVLKEDGRGVLVGALGSALGAGLTGL